MAIVVCRSFAFLVAVGLLVGSSARGAEWGTLKGRFVFEGTAPPAKVLEPNKDQATCAKHKLLDENLVVGPNGGLKNVVIFVRTKNPPVSPEYSKTANDEVELDNKDCRFQPHVQTLRTSQTLVVKNSDPIGHNSNLQGIANPGANPLIPANSSTSLKFSAEETLPMTVSCNIHQWMKGYVVVRSNPYMAVTDENGSFTIKDLPRDKELEYQLWQEQAGYLKNVTFKGGKADSKGRFKLTLKQDETDLGDIKAPASVFKK